MSASREWLTAKAVICSVVTPGKPAGDGQTAEHGGYVLELSHGDSYGAAIEGTKAELLALLDRARAAITEAA